MPTTNKVLVPLFTRIDDLVNFSTLVASTYSHNSFYNASLGNDTIIFGEKNWVSFDSTLMFNAGGGNDWISGNSENNVINASSGDDTVYGNGGDDTLYGALGKDLIYGGFGNDKISGGADHDILHGGQGNDVVYGDTGNDQLYGQAGDDVLLGGVGNDYLSGGENNDYLDGGSGRDRLLGGNGEDTLILRGTGGYALGGNHADYLYAYGSINKLNGDDGDDVLVSRQDNPSNHNSARANQLFGDAGDDTLSNLLGYAVLHGGTGNDTLQAGNASGATCATIMYGDEGNDNFIGSEGQDMIYGGAGTNTAMGNGGNDGYWLDVKGGAVNDTFSGGSGFDTLYLHDLFSAPRFNFDYFLNLGFLVMKNLRDENGASFPTQQYTADMYHHELNFNGSTSGEIRSSTDPNIVMLRFSGVERIELDPIPLVV